MKDAGRYLDSIAFDGITPKAGDYLRAQRKIMNITLEELSSVTGIDIANLSSYETNKKKIDIQTAAKLGAALRLDPHILIETSVSVYRNE